MHTIETGTVTEQIRTAVDDVDGCCDPDPRRLD
jgi:hypothetical protein